MRSLPISLTQLPEKWGGEGHVDQNSPRVFLENAFSIELPISGGEVMFGLKKNKQESWFTWEEYQSEEAVSSKGLGGYYTQK